VLRKPLALSNWKMAMTVSAGVAYARELVALAGDLLDAVDVVICPPYTALWPIAQVLSESRLQLGGQNMAPTAELARTGEISATLLADAGCRWVMLGHWETRRYLGDDDNSVNRKLHLALEADLTPVLLVGEGHDETDSLRAALENHLARVLEGCRAEQVARMAFVYEPEGAIGVAAPVSPDRVAAGCGVLRGLMRHRWGEAVADSVRIIYGGSVAPEQAADLLAGPDVDGLGASRRGRDPRAFAQIVRQIAEVTASRRRRMPTEEDDY
jgi:triosephosphate isomerase